MPPLAVASWSPLPGVWKSGIDSVKLISLRDCKLGMSAAEPVPELIHRKFCRIPLHPQFAAPPAESSRPVQCG